MSDRVVQAVFPVPLAGESGAKIMNAYSPITLAYVGDAVHELYARLRATAPPENRISNTHKRVVRAINAAAQARGLEFVVKDLTDEELDVVRRGRNAHSGTIPKNVDLATYHQSTSLECLIGFLFLSGRNDRLVWLLERIFEESAGAPE